LKKLHEQQRAKDVETDRAAVKKEKEEHEFTANATKIIDNYLAISSLIQGWM
jgi:hypothetical protein